MSFAEVNGQLFRCFLLTSWQIRRLSYQAPVLREVLSLLQVSRRTCTSDIPKELSLYAHMMSRPGQALAQTPPNIKAYSPAKVLLRLFFSTPKEFQLYGVF